MPKSSKLLIKLIFIIFVINYVSYELNLNCIYIYLLYLIDCILTFVSNITIGQLSVHALSVPFAPLLIYTLLFQM